MTGCDLCERFVIFFYFLKFVQKRFKRLKRMQIEDSDDEGAADDGMDREVIANQLFEGDDVSNFVENAT